MTAMTDFTCGFEWEVASNGPQTAHALYTLGLAAEDHLHSYHCSCDDCDYEADDRGFAPQEDCTVSGEMVSRLLTYGSPGYEATVEGLGRAALLARTEPGENAGCHVHVGRQFMSLADDVRLVRLFYRYQHELYVLANGRSSDVRAYNSPIRNPGHDYEAWGYNSHGEMVILSSTPSTFWTGDPEDYPGPVHSSGWLSSHGRTWEFRLWNSTVAPWRVRMYVGLSVAMCHAAVSGELVTRNDPRPLLEVLAPYMDADTTSAVLRQLFHNAADSVPSREAFTQ